MKKTIRRIMVSAVVLCVFSITAFAEKMLLPVGKVVGLALEEGTVTVVAFDDICGGEAKAAGIRIGDEIVSVNGESVDSGEQLEKLLEESGEKVTISLNRQGKIHEVSLTPCDTDQGPKLGLYIREGVTGIGTVTYFDRETGNFGALGHGVSDSMGRLAQMLQGEVYPAEIQGVKQGIPGAPGQLKGLVESENVIGALEKNTESGVFGSCEDFLGEEIPVAAPEQIHQGPAVIRSNIQGNSIKEYKVEIVKLYDRQGTEGRDLMLRVTDPELLETTGGIVAGMSGSPIIQDGRLVGAVTHVLVNDPEKGYGIFIGNMLNASP